MDNELVVSVLESKRAKCKCVGKHIPKPMELHVHYIWPLWAGGPEVTANRLYLCPTTNQNVRRLWELYESTQGRPAWEILKNYSEYVRYLVERGRELRRQATSN